MRTPMLWDKLSDTASAGTAFQAQPGRRVNEQGMGQIRTSAVRVRTSIDERWADEALTRVQLRNALVGDAGAIHIKRAHLIRECHRRRQNYHVPASSKLTAARVEALQVMTRLGEGATPESTRILHRAGES